MTDCGAVLDCPDPKHCPVGDLGDDIAFATTSLQTNAPWWRCYDSTWGYDEFNPGNGDTRFAPFVDDSGTPVPASYLAAERTAALLETVFHDIHQSADRIIYEADLRRMNLCASLAPTSAVLVDLRDDSLRAVGVDRSALVSTPTEHYPCTRRVARALYLRYPNAHGLIWHSRQAELIQAMPVEVVILFGDRYPSGRGGWQRVGFGSIALVEGPGRILVDEMASLLGGVVIPMDGK